MHYAVTLPSLHENFPPDFEVPALLLDFGSWLKNQPRGSVGWFALRSDRFDDHWIEHGADLHPYFAFFIRDPTGGQIGYWLHKGRTTKSPPIVMIGSEGELSVLSDSLEGFLLRLADRTTQAPDLDSRDEGGDGGLELSRWLKGRINNQPAIQSQPVHPDLTRWIEQWQQEQRHWIDNDPLHLQIADKLRKYVKPNAELWETANFDVLLVGEQFRLWHRSWGLQPMPQNEAADLQSLFRSVREQRANRVPERGLWLSAWVKVGTRGGANLCCNFMEKPEFLGERPVIPARDYEQDQSAFPRSAHWMPKWLQ